jgi:hypothetical protein
VYHLILGTEEDQAIARKGLRGNKTVAWKSTMPKIERFFYPLEPEMMPSRNPSPAMINEGMERGPLCLHDSGAESRQSNNH